MKPQDYAMIILLVVFGGLIWVRDLSWLGAAADTLPILAALVLLYWLGRPWRFTRQPAPLETGPVVAACLLAIFGAALNMTLLLALGWTVLFWACLKTRLPANERFRIRRLLPLAVLAFPWIALDGQVIGWWFRLSGAWATSQVFAWIQLDVTREGTLLSVQGLPVSVEAACSGLNALQAMLIAGTLAAYVQIGDRKHYWWHLPALVAVAWLANTLRILVICIMGLSAGPELASGSFHFLGGWAVLCVMFCICWIVFYIAARHESAPPCPVP